MKYRKLGNSGLIVSEVALGSMQFGEKMGMGGLDQKQTDSMVRCALDNGINFIDTADVYSLGESETLLGNALRGVRREIVLAAKRLDTYKIRHPAINIRNPLKSSVS